MGLAASQARFLAITARKMNCEFKSMQIAQEKLSITRDLQKAAQNYQNSLSTSKLMWEADDMSTYDVNYDVMMRPSALNSYDPYLITDVKGRIVLSKAMFNAALKAGVIDENGNPSGSKYTMGGADDTTGGTRNAFLNQLGVANQISKTTIQSITDLGEDGYNMAGVGGEIMDKVLAQSMTTQTFLNFLDQTNDDNSPMFSPLAGENVEIYKKDASGSYAGTKLTDTPMGETSSISAIHMYTSKDQFWDGVKNKSDSEAYYIHKDKDGNNAVNESEFKNLSLSDILRNNYYIVTQSTTNDQNKFSPFLDLIEKAFTNALSRDYESRQAIAQAKTYTLSMLSNEKRRHSRGVDGFDYNVISYFDNGASGLSLTNLAKTFLTYYAIALEGYQNFNIDETVKKSKYVTDDLAYTFTTSNPGGVHEQDALNANFYNMLYNNLCMYGACTDQTMQEQVTNQEYLNYALKNGQLFVSSLNDDGYYYQGGYTLNGHIEEVPDEAAIARAEVEYNVTKSRLNAKEESLELDMKNLDMEISSLTTEFDTVKQLISKNVEKVFTMFST